MDRNARETRAGARSIALAQVQKRLKKFGPMSARKLAGLLGCSKPAAYARLEALEASGVKLYRSTAREGKCGPVSIVFALAN